MISHKSTAFLLVLISLTFLLLGSGCAIKHKREADASKIIDAYKAQREQVKNCYFKALETNAQLKGEVTLAWVVDGKGALKKAWVKDTTMNDADMESCLLEHLKTVSFPKTQNLAKITVEYTLTFDRQEKK